MPRERTRPYRVYEMKVTLREVMPTIWRRFEVPGDISLNRLHRVLQRVMGWTESHLHLFEINGEEFGPPDPDGDLTHKDDRRVVLDRFALEPGSTFQYLYDYGDNWQHDLLVETVGMPDPRMAYPCCLSGARACPPEDVGSVTGYRDFLVGIREPKHPEHDTWLTWTGGVFDPEGFDVNAVNRRLWEMR